MNSFHYSARNNDGRILHGQQQANSVVALRSILQSRGLRLLSYKPIVANQTPLEWMNQYLNPLQWIPPRSIDVQVLLDQLAIMLQSGLTLLDALGTAGEQAAVYPMRRVCQQMSGAIQEGKTFAESMEQHTCFPAIVVQLVRVGEQTGNLDYVLNRASKQIAQRRQNITNLMTALAYPIFVALAAIAVAIYLVVFVIPQLEKFLSAMGRKLPQMTQNLVSLSKWVENNGTSTLLGIALLSTAVVLFYNTSSGRFLIDRLCLRIPIVGRVFRLSATVTFASSLGVMVRSGITVLDALRTVEGLHMNRFLRSRVSLAREGILRGEGLASSLNGKYDYMPMLSSMVAVGERTGQLDEILEQVSHFHEQQLQSAIKRLSAMVEPAVIMIVGGIVGYVYISFFVALFSVGASPR